MGLYNKGKISRKIPTQGPSLPVFDETRFFQDVADTTREIARESNKVVSDYFEPLVSQAPAPLTHLEPVEWKDFGEEANDYENPCHKLHQPNQHQREAQAWLPSIIHAPRPFYENHFGNGSTSAPSILHETHTPIDSPPLGFKFRKLTTRR
jgi:hypothetical protein